MNQLTKLSANFKRIFAMNNKTKIVFFSLLISSFINVSCKMETSKEKATTGVTKIVNRLMDKK